MRAPLWYGVVEALADGHNQADPYDEDRKHEISEQEVVATGATTGRGIS